MVKNKEESNDCKDKKLKDKNNGGYRELKDPLLGKAKRHTASAMKKDADAISDDIAILKKIDDVEIPNADENSEILRYKDSDKFLDAVYQFEEQKNITVPLDWDSNSNSFLVLVSKEISNEFQDFIKEKVGEIPDTREIDEKIAEVQNSRSKSALGKDNSITAQKVGKKENPEDLKAWLAHPNLSDLENIDTAPEKS